MSTPGPMLETTLETAIAGLRDALNHPPDERRWGWQVRHRLSAVKEALTAETDPSGEAWLAARTRTVLRDRNALLGRVTTLGPLVLEGASEPVRARLQRLVLDLEHHRQRLSDLMYDSVCLELGGSE